MQVNTSKFQCIFKPLTNKEIMLKIIDPTVNCTYIPCKSIWHYNRWEKASRQINVVYQFKDMI